MKPLVLFLLAVVLLSSCKKDDQRDLPPRRTNLVLLAKDGSELLTSLASPLRITTTAAGQFIELIPNCGEGCGTVIQEFTPTSNQPYRFVCISGDLTGYSLKQEYTWHLTLNGKTDTLCYQLRDASSANTVMQVVKATFNGESVQPDAQLHDQFAGPIFVLRRRH